MAIQFPSSPTLNDTYVYNSITWTYNGTAWTKASAGGGGGGGASVTVSTTAPTSPTSGAIWLKDDTGDLYVYGVGGWILTGVNPGPSFSGSYNDLTDKPTITSVIPSAISDQPNTSTGYFDLPMGTTAQRPVSPSSGFTRINSTTNYIETYYNDAWISTTYLGMIMATGGSVVTLGNYRIHTFTASGSLNILTANPTSGIDILVVGGGGAGGNAGSSAYETGGGGAGGLVYKTGLAVNSGETYTITIGAGGPLGSGLNGVNSSFGTALVALGGGAGAVNGAAGSAGGSGGGGTHNGSAGGAGIQTTSVLLNSDSRTSGFGNAGGVGGTSKGGGGGGAGAAGSAHNVNNGQGGIGISYDISGTTTYYAGGGGGGSPVAGLGGQGGGGNGSSGSPGSSGTINTGGGGGGGNGSAGAQGGAGGSGIVIVKYRFQ